MLCKKQDLSTCCKSNYQGNLESITVVTSPFLSTTRQHKLLLDWIQIAPEITFYDICIFKYYKYYVLYQIWTVTKSRMHLRQSLSWMWWHIFLRMGPFFMNTPFHFTPFPAMKGSFWITKQCSKPPYMQNVDKCMSGRGISLKCFFEKSLSHKDLNLTRCVHDSMSFVFYGHPVYNFKIFQEEKDHEFKTQ